MLPTQTTKVLIIDDVLAVHHLIGEYLEYFGLKVESATSGHEGLAKVQSSDIGAVYIDDHLGDITGVEIAKQIRDVYPEKEIFFVAGSSRKFWESALERAGLTDVKFFVKGDLLSQTNEKREFLNYVRACVDRHERWLKTFLADIRLDCIDLALYRALHDHPELMRSLDWRKFEELLADVLKTLGYEIELMQGTKDGGVDIFALKSSDYLGGHRYLVQAKRWNRRVGIEPVQRLLFQQSHLGATKACLATTATFTRGAWSLAKEYQWQLELRDYNGLREWLEAALEKKLKL